jgi:hypothetical protein
VESQNGDRLGNLESAVSGLRTTIEVRCQTTESQNAERFGALEKELGKLKTGIAEIKSEAGRFGEQNAEMTKAIRVCQEANSLNEQYRGRTEALEAHCQAAERQNGEPSGNLEKEVGELKKAVAGIKNDADRLRDQNGEMTKAIRLCQEPPGLCLEQTQIISSLFLRSGGNAEKFVKVTATSSLGTGFEATNVLDPRVSSYFCSQNAADQSITWVFPGVILRPSAYAIRSAPRVVGWCHPKSWVLESANSGSDGPWTEIHKVVNDSELNAPSVLARYRITTEADCRCIRFTQTGPTHHGSHYLGFATVEFFGSIREG